MTKIQEILKTNKLLTKNCQLKNDYNNHNNIENSLRIQDCWHYDSGVVLDGKLIQVINQEGRRKYVQQVRPRRYTMQNPRPGTQASRSGGASVLCTHFKAEISTWGFLVWYLADGFCVSMVSARGIVPCFGEKLAYIKQRSSFGLIMFLVEHLMRVRSGLDLNKANLMDRDLFGSCSDL